MNTKIIVQTTSSTLPVIALKFTPADNDSYSYLSIFQLKKDTNSSTESYEAFQPLKLSPGKWKVDNIVFKNIFDQEPHPLTTIDIPKETEFSFHINL